MKKFLVGMFMTLFMVCSVSIVGYASDNPVKEKAKVEVSKVHVEMEANVDFIYFDDSVNDLFLARGVSYAPAEVDLKSGKPILTASYLTDLRFRYRINEMAVNKLNYQKDLTVLYISYPSKFLILQD